MNQGLITCSFCSAEFTVPQGLNEAVCPKCGKAMPLFSTKIGISSTDVLGQDPGFEEEIWDSVEDMQEVDQEDGGDVVGRINLKQVQAHRNATSARTMMGQGAPGPAGLDALATTDDEGCLIPDMIHGDTGDHEVDGASGSRSAKPLAEGFDLGPEPVAPSSNNGEGSSVRDLAPLTDHGIGPEIEDSSRPNLLADLDAELDGNSQEGDGEIPEAEPLEMDQGMIDEVSSFFDAEETPGLNLPDQGGIAVSIPEEPIQERMRSEAVAISSSTSTPAVTNTSGSSPADDRKSTTSSSAPDDLPPILRTAIFVGIGIGVLSLLGFLYWLIQ